jgi:hypothetical protein
MLRLIDVSFFYLEQQAVIVGVTLSGLRHRVLSSYSILSCGAAAGS